METPKKTSYTHGYQLIKELTKREYFAAKALAGLVTQFDQGEFYPENYAKKAVELADELIKALRGGE